MSFENIKNAIASVELNQPSTISLSDGFDLLSCIINDVNAFNSQKSFSESPVGDNNNLISKLITVSAVVDKCCEKINLEDQIPLMAKMLSDLRTKLIDNEAKLVEINEDLQSAQKQKDILDQKESELREERGHLLTVKEENEVLQAEIDRLSDPYLDQLTEQKSELEATVQVKQKKEGELKAELSRQQSSLESIEANLQKSKVELAEVQRKFDTLSEQIEKNKTSKAGLEKGIENQKNDLKELKKWHQEFETKNHKLHEVTNQINELINACNSMIKNDTFILRIDEQKMIDYNVFSAEDKENITFDGKELKCVKDLEKYLDSLMSRIDALLAIYQKVFKEFHQQADKVLNNSEIDNK